MRPDEIDKFLKDVRSTTERAVGSWPSKKRAQEVFGQFAKAVQKTDPQLAEVVLSAADSWPEKRRSTGRLIVGAKGKWRLVPYSYHRRILASEFQIGADELDGFGSIGQDDWNDKFRPGKRYWLALGQAWTKVFPEYREFIWTYGF